MRSNNELLGIIRSAVMFGRSERHYDIVFYNDRIEIIYLGEYKSSRIRQMLGRNADTLIYRILKEKRRSTKSDEDTLKISAKDITSIKLKHVQSSRDNSKRNYVLLEINTTKGKYEFYINAKIMGVVKSIVNKFHKRLREK